MFHKNASFADVVHLGLGRNHIGWEEIVFRVSAGEKDLLI